MKRLIREAVRLHWKDWKLEGEDIVVIPKKGAGRYCFSDITTEFHNTFHIKEQGGRRC
jgi:ribonuclease P protein component